MSEFYKDSDTIIFKGDALENLKLIETNTIQCVITSPPYYALRKYGDNVETSDKEIGRAKTFQDYINNLIKVFREIKRVLKKDGLLFVNLGDTYCGTGSKKEYKDSLYHGRNGQSESLNMKQEGIKRKSLIGIPQRFMIAMIDDGWICRNNIIWHKPNAMPESVKDRFTVDFENIFMFSLNQKYKFNQIKVSMKTRCLDKPKGSRGSLTPQSGRRDKNGELENVEYKRNKRTVWTINNNSSDVGHYAVYPEELIEDIIKCSTDKGDWLLDPFIGSGTTAVTSKRYQRKAIGIELYEKNCMIIKKRLKNIQTKLEI